MKRLISGIAVIALICPAMAFASHHKKRAAQPQSGSQPNLLGKVVHGSRPVSAKVSVHMQGHNTRHHPSVSSAGEFRMHLPPGTYSVSAKRHGAGNGHILVHLDQGQTLNVTVPIYHHHRSVHYHQAHHLGVMHHVTRTVPVAKAPAAPSKPVITVPTAGRVNPQ